MRELTPYLEDLFEIVKGEADDWLDGICESDEAMSQIVRRIREYEELQKEENVADNADASVTVNVIKDPASRERLQDLFQQLVDMVTEHSEQYGVCRIDVSWDEVNPLEVLGVKL